MVDTSSDPLPFIQVDRTAKPKASALAGFLGTSPQHALGSLIHFWDMVGDPRDIEKLLEAGISFIALQGEDISRKFEIASGKKTDPENLEALGLLENLGNNKYRIRGMSRYIEPIQKRIQARKAAAEGGKISAAKLKRVNGRFVKATENIAGSQLEFPPSDSPAIHQLAGATLETRLDKKPSENQVRGQRSEYITNTKEYMSSGADEPDLTEPEKKRVSDLQQAWNENTDSLLFPRWKETGRARAVAAKARLSERPLSEWVEVIRRINVSNFCRGQNKDGWVASPTFLLRPETATKVLEGTYDNRANVGPPKDVRKGMVMAQDVKHGEYVGVVHDW